jgi:hypothetical protein
MPRTAERAPVRPVLVDKRIASHDFSGFEVGDLAKIELRSDVFVGKDVASNQNQRLTTVRTVDQLLPAAIVGVRRRLSVSALRRESFWTLQPPPPQASWIPLPPLEMAMPATGTAASARTTFADQRERCCGPGCGTYGLRRDSEPAYGERGGQYRGPWADKSLPRRAAESYDTL